MSTNNEHYVRFEHVSKTFADGHCAIKDADFSIRRGELLVLIGPSGCGKSTLLRMLAGLEECTGGKLWIDALCVNEQAPKDRDIAMVFQNYALYPHMSVAENLSFGLRLRGIPSAQIQERIQAAAKTLQLEALLARKPAALSGGQRQRVALGRALVRQPKVFLLDEPLSNLDASLRTSMRVEIARLHRSLGTTMIYVTHDQVEAMTLGQRIAVLKDGVIQQLDTPLNVYRHPVNAFVAGFLGSPQMNLVQGQLQQSSAGFAVQIGAEKLMLPEYTVLNYVAGMQVLLGVRAEHFSVLRQDNPPTTAAHLAGLSAEVELVEDIGADVFLHLLIPMATPMRLVVRADSARTSPQLRAGDSVQLNLAGDWHLFDAETGARIECQLTF